MGALSLAGLVPQLKLVYPSSTRVYPSSHFCTQLTLLYPRVYPSSHFCTGYVRDGRIMAPLYLLPLFRAHGRATVKQFKKGWGAFLESAEMDIMVAVAA